MKREDEDATLTAMWTLLKLVGDERCDYDYAALGEVLGTSATVAKARVVELERKRLVAWSKHPAGYRDRLVGCGITDSRGWRRLEKLRVVPVVTVSFSF